MQLHNRRIIVTGSARGMGEATVLAAVAAGAQVVALDVLTDQGQRVVARANGTGPGRASFLACDVASRDAVFNTVGRAVEILGGVDALAHIAGVERTAPAEDIDDAHWELMMDVNAKGTMYMNQAIFPFMRDKGGQIVNFASAAGVRGMPGGAAYSASKGAVLAWSRCVAQEWARYRITVNCVAPGIWTPMYEAHRAQMSPQELASHDATMAGAVPLGGRLGDPMEDFAPVMLFLLSDAAHFMTAQTLPVDGGMLILT